MTGVNRIEEARETTDHGRDDCRMKDSILIPPNEISAGTYSANIDNSQILFSWPVKEFLKQIHFHQMRMGTDRKKNA